MPRPSLKDSPDVAKRAPRRQVVRRVTVPRTRKVATEPVPEIIEEKVLERKAPARFTEAKTPRRFSRRTIITSSIFVVGLIAAIWIGTSDNGQINVSALITERNNQVANGEAGDSDSGDGNTQQVVPVQSSAPTVPNGGLRGQGISNTPPPPPVEVASSTEATTTATSTDDVTEENSDNSSAVETINSDTNTTQPESAPENPVAPAN